MENRCILCNSKEDVKEALLKNKKLVLNTGYFKADVSSHEKEIIKYFNGGDGPFFICVNRKTCNSEQYIKNRFRTEFLDILQNNKKQFIKYSFNRYDGIELKFKYPFPIVEHLNYILCSSMSTFKDHSNPDDCVIYNMKYFSASVIESKEYDLTDIEFMKSVYIILKINPTDEKLKIAQEKEIRRVEKINKYLKKCIDSDIEINFTNISNGYPVLVKPSEIFTNLFFVENPDSGIYNLHYKDGTSKTFFNLPIDHEVKGSSGLGYCYNTIEDKITDLKKRHKKKSLLLGTLLCFNNEIDNLYFCYLMKTHNVKFSHEPSYNHAFEIKNLNYTSFFNVYKRKDFKRALPLNN